MTRIGNTGVGGPKPAAGPESTENVKETSAASESAPTTNTSTPESTSASSKPSADKHVLGDLKNVGTFLRTQLESVLQTKQTGGDTGATPEGKAKADAGLTPEQKAKADKLPKGELPHFAPPYVPVGPVVTGDNIGVPGQPVSGDGSVRPNQLPQGQQPQFAPPYVPVGPVVAGDNIGIPGNAGINPETRELNFSPDQFQINDQGNLVITNQQLIEYFKSLKENAGGQDIRLGVTNRTPTGEE